jgi:DNA-directed RNA polymerase specialized sigma24 family protein
VGETSLHEAVKRWYAQPGDRLEAWVDGYLIDIVRGDQLIEIQTGNFSAIKAKLKNLVRRHPVRLVHTIAHTKWIVRLDTRGRRVSRRRSPRRGRVEDLFLELVYIPHLMEEPKFSLEALMVHSEEELIDDGRGSWRRRRWSVNDRRLLDVVGRAAFSAPADLRKLLPEALPEEFTTRELAEGLRLRAGIAQKMTYCLHHMGVLDTIGKRGRARLYSLKRESTTLARLE